MALSVGFRITVSLLILLPKLRGSDSYPGGTVSHRTRQPSLDAQRLLSGIRIRQILSFEASMAFEVIFAYRLAEVAPVAAGKVVIREPQISQHLPESCIGPQACHIGTP